MDSYAGGIGSYYRFNSKQLAKAKARIEELIGMAEQLKADNLHDLLFIFELKERLVVCLTLIAHLGARKETRWHSFAENLDYPETSDEWLCYVNSVATEKGIEIRQRPLVTTTHYKHQDGTVLSKGGAL